LVGLKLEEDSVVKSSTTARIASWRVVVSAFAAASMVLACGTATAPSATTLPSVLPSGEGSASASAALGDLPPPEQTSIKIGSNAVSGNNFPVKFALDKGLYEKHGLDAEVTVFEGTASATALLAGQIDILRGGAEATFFSQRTNKPIIFISSFYDKFLDDFVAAKDVETGDDLKGKRIGANTLGAQAHQESVLAVEALGLAPGDVEIVEIGGQSDRIAALQSGAVSAIVADASAAADLEAEGYNILLKLSELPNRQALGPIIVTRDYAEQNPNTVLAVVAAMLDALQLMYTETDDAVAGLAEWAQVPPEDAKAEIEEFLEAASRDLKFTREGMVTLQEFLALADPSIGEINVDDTYSLEFLQKLEDLGYYKAAGVPGY
jgi:NitT/TauT family transport system substrate-binding protein